MGLRGTANVASVLISRAWVGWRLHGRFWRNLSVSFGWYGLRSVARFRAYFWASNIMAQVASNYSFKPSSMVPFNSSVRKHMRIAIYLAFVSMLASMSSSVLAHHGCYNMSCDSMQACKESAGWILEGTVTNIISTGGQQECETGPGNPSCGYVENPEIIELSGVVVVKGLYKVDARVTTKVSRKDACFSGPLSVTNSKSELQFLNRKVRVFGNSDTAPPYVKEGYFLIEPIEENRKS